MSLLDLVTLVDNAPLDFETSFSPFYRLFLPSDPRPHGFIHPSSLPLLPPSFQTDHALRSVTISQPPGSSNLDRDLTAHINAALQAVVDAAIANPAFPFITSHSEPFRIIGARGLIHVERFAATVLGIATRGAHCTAFVRDKTTGELQIWVAKRSRELHTYPGLWDSTVAGGVKAHDGPGGCVREEASEEASLPGWVCDKIRAVGVVTLANINPRGLFHSEVLYVYDLDLTPDTPAAWDGRGGGLDSGGVVVPTPGDGEVEEFVLMSCEEVLRRMLRGEFKPNVCPVMIDFMVRHGVITPESERDYVEICARLRRNLPVPLTDDTLSSRSQ